MNGYIEVVNGTLGGGKTLLAVERMLDKLVQGGEVFTNVELYPDKIAEAIGRRGYVFDPARLHVLPPTVNVQNIAGHLKRGTKDNLVMLVWDEASFDINAKEHQRLQSEFRSLCILARKLDIHAILITQVFNDLDNQVRGKVQKQWMCRNLSSFRILWGLVPCPFPLMFRVCYHIGGFAKAQYSHTEIVWRSSEAMGLYNSDALLGPDAGKFEALEVANVRPLERKSLPPDRVKPFLYLAGLCASFFASF